MMPSRFATRLFGKIVPAGLLTYFTCAWYVCTFHVGYGYLYRSQGHRSIGLGYVVITQLLIGTILRAYARLLLLAVHHGRPNSEPSEGYLSRPVIEIVKPAQGIFEDSHLAPRDWWVPRCWKDECKGRWKPPKTRHCGVCGTCQVGFDHHCPWFDNCLTATHYKPFLHLLCLTPLAVIVLTSPLWRLLSSQIPLIFAASYGDAASRAKWWDWWPSWVIFGGPVGRYVVGGWLGLRVLVKEREAIGMASAGWGSLVAQPSGVAMMLVLFGLALAGVSAGLAFFSIRVILAGELTVDEERRKAFRRLANSAAFMPKSLPAALIARLDALDECLWFRLRYNDEVVHIQSLLGDSPYDLGPLKNWERVMGKGWRCLDLRYAATQDEMSVWEVSPAYLSTLRERVRKTA